MRNAYAVTRGGTRAVVTAYVLTIRAADHPEGEEETSDLESSVTKLFGQSARNPRYAISGPRNPALWPSMTSIVLANVLPFTRGRLRDPQGPKDEMVGDLKT